MFWHMHKWSMWKDTGTVCSIATKAVQDAKSMGIDIDSLTGDVYVKQERRCETCGKLQLRKAELL